MLVGQLAQQPRRVALQRVVAFRSSKADLKDLQKLMQLRQRRRTGMDMHRYPPFTEETHHRILTE
jgi:hypothetical protein